jgi:hypothetical protein
MRALLCKRRAASILKFQNFQLMQLNLSFILWCICIGLYASLYAYVGLF